MIESGRRIRRAAVLGAGVIGSQIAAQFSNAGIHVLLFELTPEGADDPRAGARRAISFRLEDYGSGQETVLAALSIALLVLALTVGYFLLDRVSVPGRPEL